VIIKDKKRIFKMNKKDIEIIGYINWLDRCKILTGIAFIGLFLSLGLIHIFLALLSVIICIIFTIFGFIKIDEVKKKLFKLLKKNAK